MKFGIQKFLNPADSRDSGYLKLSILPNGYEEKRKNDYFGHTITFQLADCQDKIHLDFDGWHFYHYNSDKPVQKSVLRESLKTLRQRRKKMKLFVDSINKFAEKVYEAMDEDEKKFLEMLNEAD